MFKYFYEILKQSTVSGWLFIVNLNLNIPGLLLK